MVNPNRAEKTVSVTLSQGQWKNVRRVWGEGAVSIEGRTVNVRLDERDAARHRAPRARVGEADILEGVQLIVKLIRERLPKVSLPA